MATTKFLISAAIRFWQRYALGQVASQWHVAGLGGFSGSDTSDMLLRNSIDGSFQVDDVSNNNITNSVALGQVGLEWAVTGFGELLKPRRRNRHGDAQQQ